MARRSLRRAAVLLLAAPVLLGAAWLVAGATFRPGDKEELPPEEGGPDASAVAVTVAPVARRPLRRTVEAMGTLHAFEEVALAARVEGRVQKVHHDVADRVPPGEVLLELDPTDHDLAVEQAERALGVELAKLGLERPPTALVDVEKVPAVMQAQTRMENARGRYERSRRLRASRASSQEEVEGLLSDSRSAQAEHANQVLLAKGVLATIRLRQTALAVARQQQRDTKVRVPAPSFTVPGAPGGPVYAITSRGVSEGSLVRPGTEVFRLVIVQALKLRVAVPERFSGEVKPGQTVDVHTAALPQPVVGTVTRINPAVSQTTRTFQVEVQVANPRGELKPGGFARAAIRTREDTAALVPLSAVVQFAGVTKVFLADGGRAREVQVTLGDQVGEHVEIASPALPAGARVITSGQTVLARDTPIRAR
jgi:RND family efflux transporter MFP subunit